MSVLFSTVARGRLQKMVAGLLPALALVALMVHGSAAHAVVLTWNTFGGGNYNDANNWFGGGPPTGADYVKFELAMGFPYTVTFPGNDLVISGGNGGGGSGIANYQARIMQIRDNGLSFMGSTSPGKGASSLTLTETGQTEALRALVIGGFSGENASLTLKHQGFTGGGLASMTMAAATLGDDAGATGALNVNVGQFNITGSDFTQTQFIVGNRGNGSVSVGNGAKVNVTGSNSRTSLAHNAGASGAMTISGAGSTWTSANELWVGEKGAGSLTVQAGGSLVTSGTGGTSSAILGTFAGSHGSALVTGAGSTWTNNANLRVGNTGDGDLTIANGGRLVSTNGANIEVGGGSGTSGNVTVTGAGSQFTTPGTVYVGTTGHGTIAVTNGASFTAGSMLIRGLNTGTGDVLVGGAGSTMNITTSPLTIGLPESGFTTGPTSFTVNPGAKVNIAKEIDLNQKGKLKLNGGELTAKSISSHLVLSQNFQGTFEWVGGTLHTGFIGGSVTNQGGKLAPGSPIGQTIIDGNYTQQGAATMAFDIGGATQSTQFDFVSLEGAANLAGSLELSLANSFMPAPAQTFSVLNSLSGIVGAFGNVASGQRLATLDGLGSFQVNYGSGSVFDVNQIVLSNFEPTPGDFNNDGVINGADLEKWKSGFGSTGSGQLGGGPMTGDDFLNWQRGLGRGGSPAATAPSIKGVPEPASLVLVAMAAFSFTAVRRASRKRVGESY